MEARCVGGVVLEVVIPTSPTRRAWAQRILRYLDTTAWVMIRRLADEGGFRPVEWRWSGLPQVREREISSFWILLMLCFYYFINGRVCFVTQVYNLPTLPE